MLGYGTGFLGGNSDIGFLDANSSKHFLGGAGHLRSHDDVNDGHDGGGRYKHSTQQGDEMILDIPPETRTVKACWSRLGNVDLDGDIIVAEAFTKTIKERGPEGKNMIWSLVDHKADMAHTLGKPKELYVEGDMLVAVTDLIETECGEDAIKLYEAGLINQHSIGSS